jgi:O-antigen ligase
MTSQAQTNVAKHPRNWPSKQSRQAQESNAGFYLVLASLLFEFGRPQELIPGVKLIPFATGLDAILLLSVVATGKLDLSKLQTKLWIPLFVVLAIHVPTATNNFWALMVFKDMLLLFGLYLGIVVYVNSLEKMLRLMKVWLGLHTFLAVIGIANRGNGIGGWMGDENDFCMVMDMIVPFAYFFLFSASGGAARIRYLAQLGIFILAAMATLSRGGFIGLASVGAYGWYRSPKKGKALVVLVIAGLFMALLAPETYWDEIASSTSAETMGADGTGGARLYTWGIGMKMFLHNPIIGVGQSNFQWAFSEYEAGETFNERSFAGRMAHSAWVTLISELGLAGIVIIGGMLWQSYIDLKLVRMKYAPVKSPLKHGQAMQVGEDVRMYLARAMEGSLIGYIISSVFISTLWYPSMWVMFAFVVALRNISETQSEGGSLEAGRTQYPQGIPFARSGGRPVSSL